MPERTGRETSTRGHRFEANIKQISTNWRLISIFSFYEADDLLCCRVPASVCEVQFCICVKHILILRASENSAKNKTGLKLVQVKFSHDDSV